jgi:hypothetical protein
MIWTTGEHLYTAYSAPRVKDARHTSYSDNDLKKAGFKTSVDDAAGDIEGSTQVQLVSNHRFRLSINSSERAQREFNPRLTCKSQLVLSLAPGAGVHGRGAK